MKSVYQAIVSLLYLSIYKEDLFARLQTATATTNQKLKTPTNTTPTDILQAESIQQLQTQKHTLDNLWV